MTASCTPCCERWPAGAPGQRHQRRALRRALPAHVVGADAHRRLLPAVDAVAAVLPARQVARLRAARPRLPRTRVDLRAVRRGDGAAAVARQPPEGLRRLLPDVQGRRAVVARLRGVGGGLPGAVLRPGGVLPRFLAARCRSGGGGPAGTTGTAGSGGAPDMWARFAAKALHVQGNKIVDTTGATFRMLGVNRAGSEDMRSPPTTGSYVFDGPTGPSTINGMKDLAHQHRAPADERELLAGDQRGAGDRTAVSRRCHRLRVPAAPRRHLRRPRPALVGAGHHRDNGRSER